VGRFVGSMATVWLALHWSYVAAESNALAAHFERIELVRTGDPPGIAVVRFDEGRSDPQLDSGLGAEYGEIGWYDAPLDTWEIVLSRKHPELRYVVEERVVTYLNISVEGPHISLDVESTTDWVPLSDTPDGHFQVMALPPAPLQLTQQQIVELVEQQQPDWVEYAHQCTGPDMGPCYTVSDQEFRISVVRDQVLESLGTFRVYQPDGC
jgi:hypothetical protein